MNRYLYKVLTCTLACLIIMGCSASNKSAQNAADASQTADSQTKPQTMRFSDLPKPSYQYDFHRFKFIIPQNKEVEISYFAKDLYQSLFADDPSKNPVIFYGNEYSETDGDKDTFMISLHTASDGIYERYDMSVEPLYSRHDDAFVSKIYKMNGDQKTYVKDTIEYKAQKGEEPVDLIRRYDDSDEYGEFEFRYPGSNWGDEALGVIDGKFDLESILAFIEQNLISEVLGANAYERAVDSTQPFFVRFDGKSQINQKDALIFTIGIANVDNETPFFMMGIDSDKQIYIYEGQPVFVTNIPAQIEAPTCQEVDNVTFSSGGHTYYYPGFSIVVGSDRFKKGKLSLPTAAAGAVEAIRSLNYLLPINTIQDLDTGFNRYSLVTGGSVYHTDIGINDHDSKDNIALRLDDVAKIEGSDAYVMTVGGEMKFVSDFVPGHKIAVSQTGKFYTFKYVPVLLGKMGEAAKQAKDYMFSEDYYTSSECYGYSSDHIDYEVEYGVSDQIDSYFTDDTDVDEACSKFNEMADYIQSHYIADSSSKLQNWFILLADKTEINVTDDNGEDKVVSAYEFHVGKRGKSDKLNVMAKITFGDDGVVRVEDGSDDIRELGNYKKKAE